jgi:hypothetical protein
VGVDVRDRERQGQTACVDRVSPELEELAVVLDNESRQPIRELAAVAEKRERIVARPRWVVLGVEPSAAGIPPMSSLLRKKSRSRSRIRVTELP